MPQMNPSLNIEVLLVTADLGDRPALMRIFSHSNWRLLTCGTIAEASELIHARPVSVVICKDFVPDGNWKELLNTNSKPNHPKVFVASASATAHLWAEALREGADYVLETPFNPRDVYRAVSDAWQRWRYMHVDEPQFDCSPKQHRKSTQVQFSRMRQSAVSA